MPTIGWRLEAKFDGWTDITGYLWNLGGIKRGRSGDLEMVEAGTLVAVLDNRDGRFTPENTQSPYAGLVKPGVPVRLSVMGGTEMALVDDTVVLVDDPDAGVEGLAVRPLFTGEAQGWPPTWSPGGRPEVMLEAVDGFEKLNSIGIDYAYSMHLRTQHSPGAYWGVLQEKQSQTPLDLTLETPSKGSVTSGGAALVTGGEGSLVVTGEVTGLATETGGAANYSVPASWVGTSNDLTFSLMLVNDDDATTLDPRVVIAEVIRGSSQLAERPDTGGWLLRVSSAGRLQFIAYTDSGTLDGGLSDDLDWTIGKAYHVAFHWDQSTQTVTFYRDGVSVGSATLTVTPSGSGTARFRLGRPDIDSAQVWRMAEPSLFTSDQTSILSTLVDARGGFASDRPSERIGRVLDWSGWDASTRDIDDGTTLLAGVPGGESILTACQDAAAADGGVFYVAKDGTATFQGRRSRWRDDAAIVATFDDDGTATGYQGTGWRFDKTLLHNDIHVDSSTRGTSDGRAEDADSQAEYGRRSLAIPTISNNSADNAQRARWELARRRAPHLRLEELNFRVGKDIQAETAAALELQDLVRVVRRPGPGQDTVDVTLRVASIEHRSPDQPDWRVRFGLLEADTDQVGIYGEAVYGTDYYGY